MKFVASGISVIARVLAFIACVALFLMMIQTVVDVAMQNFRGKPIEGNLEILSAYHMVAIVFLPLAFVEMRHEHISVDLLVQMFPAWLRRSTDTIGYLVAATFFAMLTYQTGIDAIQSFRINEIMMTSIFITIWPAKFSLPIGFAAITLASLLHAWQAATDPSFDPTPADPDLPVETRRSQGTFHG